VELTGPLRDRVGFTPYAGQSDSTGAFGFMDIVPLGNYWGNQLFAWSSYQVGQQTILYYYGVSCFFDVNCFVIGQVAQVSINIPLWII
jgi:hypothetical protein